jgi:hypothetical protein
MVSSPVTCGSLRTPSRLSSLSVPPYYSPSSSAPHWPSFSKLEGEVVAVPAGGVSQGYLRDVIEILLTQHLFRLGIPLSFTRALHLR